MADSPSVPSATADAGISAGEAARRLARDGHNELPAAKPRSFPAIAGSVMREPMFLLLLACGAVYLFLGDTGEALMLLGFVVIIIVITLVQEQKAERALDALRDLASPRALVLRDGSPVRIAGRDVVAGDLLLLAEGDRVAADAALVVGTTLSVDESLLTGESVPVSKLPAGELPARMALPGGDSSPFLFSGSMVLQGKGRAVVLATGNATALGRIGQALASVRTGPTRIQQETARLVKRIAWAGAGLSVLLALAYGLRNGDWIGATLTGITLAMAILPEELPVVLALFLALGAWRMARHQVLTRHVPALEMLGSATVLCVDKTGTLTENRMRLVRLHASGEDYAPGAGQAALPETFHTLLEFSMLASHRDPFDPMEQAIKAATAAHLAGTEHVHTDWLLVEDYPLSPELLAMSRVWQSPDQDNFVIAAKGAAEAIFDLCHLDHAQTARLTAAAEAMGAQGLRVLGVARAAFKRGALPPLQHDFEFVFLGLIALADPVRATVPAAVAECRAAGIRVIMITGDYPATAASIAAQAGLQSAGLPVSGAALGKFSESELRAVVRDSNVFCRAVPEDKLRIVAALQANGEVVAMTGDGVNDAPALKAAQIGIAMGRRGTDVAREAADLVLLDDDFLSIVTAVRFGRRIFANLRKAFVFVVAVHIPIVGMSLLPVLLGWPVLLLPVHILFLQLIIDPACAIVFEAEPDDAADMRKPPRPPGTALLDPRSILLGTLQGGLILAVLLTAYGIAQNAGASQDQARTLGFAILVLASVGLILCSRSRAAGPPSAMPAGNPALWWISGGALVLLAMVLWVPALRSLFRFAPLDSAQIALAAVCAGACIAVFELLKRVPRLAH